MVSLCAIIVGGLFALLGVKRGLYRTWGSLFNILISVYLGIMLTPLVATFTVDLKENSYYLAGCVIVLSCIIFGILESFTKTYLTGTFKGTFPKVFEQASAGVLGFLSGYVVCAFVFFVIGIMPVMRLPVMEKVFGEKGFADTAQRPLKKACNFVGVASMQCYGDSGSGVIDWLVTTSREEQESSEYYEEDIYETSEEYDDMIEDIASEIESGE